MILAAAVLLVGMAAALPVQDRPGEYSAAEIDSGSRVYNAQCAQCHGPNGDNVSGIDLRRAEFRTASTDADLARVVTRGVASAGMPPFALQAAELKGVIAYIRAGFDNSANVRIGNAARGRTIAEGKGACGSCHRINGQGPRVAPDLSDIGMARSPAALQRSIVDPSSAMLPINRPVRIVMKDGKTITGRRLNEDTKAIQLIDNQERLLSLAKIDIRTLTVETTSTMPAYASRLSADEIADVVAWLITLKERKP